MEYLHGLEDQINYIISLDLKSIVSKLVIRCGWTPNDAKKTSEMYRRYLILKLKYGSEHKLPPSEEIDEFWHHHILDTKRYYEDCKKIFGHYLHHYPYFGMDNETNLDDLNEAFAVTQRLYREEFGENIVMSKGLRSRLRIMLKEFLK